MKKLTLMIICMVGTLSYSQSWRTNFENAKSQAIKENKNILLVFSGSDWCAPCMKLDKVVWKSSEFQQESEKSWIIYKADFPKKKANQLPVELAQENKIIAERYNKEGSFPLVVLLDKYGKVLGVTGFKNVSATDYIKTIHALER
ncbi:thioredoxin family protein [Flavobacterium sp.]|uniref:thioredoxin family protein n=1 Tax=Flavobacterium sp. TaxID=239 RepID=UPI0032663DBA